MNRSTSIPMPLALILGATLLAFAAVFWVADRIRGRP